MPTPLVRVVSLGVWPWSLKMSKILESSFAMLLWAVFLLGQFPGGTIVMALKCNSTRLDGWDWVLSVVIPFYGLAKALFSSSC